jgi:hypothetical protein
MEASVLPFASQPPGGPSDSEVLAMILTVLVGAVFLIASLAVLLAWVGRRSRPRLPRITSVDEKVAELWARQTQTPLPLPQHRHAA